MVQKKGLNLLVAGSNSQVSSKKSEKLPLEKIPLTNIIPNKHQPRKLFDDSKINELSSSIREKGVLSPILVRPHGDNFEIIAGERRWLAAKLAGLETIPAFIRPANDRESLEIALIENIQRDDLNPVETAQAYQLLMEDFGMIHEQIAERVGKSRAAVTNLLRILHLPSDVLELVKNMSISLGHAKILAGIDNDEKVRSLAEKIVSEKWSVRLLEDYVHDLQVKKKVTSKSNRREKESYVKEFEKVLEDYFGTRVSIKISSNKNRGYVKIFFYSNDDFEHILAKAQNPKK